MGLSHLLIIALAALAHGAPTTTTFGAASSTLGSSMTSTQVEPCALASSASALFVSAHPSATAVSIPADIAYQCLETVPNLKDPAIELITALSVYLNFQPTLAYLKNPPSGYLLPGVDIQQGLIDINNTAVASEYKSEYDFQNAIQALLFSAHDGHLGFEGDAVGVFTFQRAVSLVSLSKDGLQIPEVYLFTDLFEALESGNIAPRTEVNASAISSIDGIDVVSFLLAQSLASLSQDPDALYNQNFFELAQYSIGLASTFISPTFYPGPSTNLTFANGTSKVFSNSAVVNTDLKRITNGTDFYTAFCIPKSTSTSASPSATASSTGSASGTASSTISTPTAVPTSPGYPLPVIKSADNKAQGFFLNGTAFQDVAVLTILSFDWTTIKEGEEFQSTVQQFLTMAQQAGKTKLIVDLQANGGGVIDFAYDTFAQLFPQMRPQTYSNMRAWQGLDAIGQGVSDLVDQVITSGGNATDRAEAGETTVFACQDDLEPNGADYPSWTSLYGPVQLYGDSFTEVIEDNFYDASLTLLADGVVITGTNNRTGFTQPFAAENMIMLYDGICASTCSIFSEMMKNLAGVEAIAVGGRPQLGPMQGVGGTKGSEIFYFDTTIDPAIQAAAQGYTAANDTEGLKKLNETFGEVFQIPAQRSAGKQKSSSDGRNQFRIGDNSQTPLQFVYEAADCRLWWTPEMMTDATFLWSRVASIAFNSSSSSSGGGASRFSSPYCIKGSTNQPTSLSGGSANSTNKLGSQIPPPGAKSIAGSLVNGTSLVNETSGGGPTSSSSSGTAGVATATSSATGSAATAQSTGAAEHTGPGCLTSIMSVAIAASVAAML